MLALKVVRSRPEMIFSVFGVKNFLIPSMESEDSKIRGMHFLGPRITGNSIPLHSAELVRECAFLVDTKIYIHYLHNSFVCVNVFILSR